MLTEDPLVSFPLSCSLVIVAREVGPPCSEAFQLPLALTQMTLGDTSCLLLVVDT